MVRLDNSCEESGVLWPLASKRATVERRRRRLSSSSAAAADGCAAAALLPLTHLRRSARVTRCVAHTKAINSTAVLRSGGRRRSPWRLAPSDASEDGVTALLMHPRRIRTAAPRVFLDTTHIWTPITCAAARCAAPASAAPLLSRKARRALTLSQSTEGVLGVRVLVIREGQEACAHGNCTCFWIE